MMEGERVRERGGVRLGRHHIIHETGRQASIRHGGMKCINARSSKTFRSFSGEMTRQRVSYICRDEG